MRTYKESLKIEKTIKFLVSTVEKFGKNPKPVIFHSIKTALILEKEGHPTKIVIAALLHDLPEDTTVKPQEIEKMFGKKVLHLIKAVSFDKKIKNEEEQYKESFARCLKFGKEALLIKAADILDNSDYYHLATDKKSRRLLLEKMKYFIKVSAPYLQKEKIWRKLFSKLKTL